MKKYKKITLFPIMFIISVTYVFIWAVSGIFVISDIINGFEYFNIWGWVIFWGLTLTYFLLRRI